MAIRTIKGGKLIDGVDYAEGSVVRVITNTTLVAGNIVIATSRVNGHMKVVKADADTAALTRGPLFLAIHDVAVVKTNKPQARVVPMGLVTGVDMSAGAVGDPVYLSQTAGAFTLTAPSALTAFKRAIGRVVTAAAANAGGAFLFGGLADGGDLNASSLGKIVSGTLTVANGASTGTAVVGTSLNGKPVVAQLQAADGTKYVMVSVVAAGTLTVTMSAAVTADRLVSYIIDGR